ncbi:MAG: hypothetical protein WDN46_14720 [Methylocella sp.]
MAIQKEPGGPYIIQAGPYAGKRVDPRSGAAIGVAVALAVAGRGPEQSPEHPALLPSEWQSLVSTDGPQINWRERPPSARLSQRA